jgi:hypothetical protein
MSAREGEKDEAGTAFIEMAAWLVVVLPLMLTSVSLAVSMHDQSVLRSIPEAVIHENGVEGIVWQGGLTEGEWMINRKELAAVVSTMADTAMERGRGHILRATKVSVKVCALVLLVDSDSGQVRSELERSCETRGPLGAELGQAGESISVVGQKIGIPLGVSSATSGYIDRIVVLGLSVGAEAADLTIPSTKRRLEFGAMSVPQREVAL